jgi:hypothetical protein
MKSVSCAYPGPGDGDSGSEEGRIRGNGNSMRAGSSVEIRRDGPASGDSVSMSENRTRLLLRDSVILRVSPMLDPIDRRS